MSFSLSTRNALFSRAYCLCRISAAHSCAGPVSSRFRTGKIPVLLGLAFLLFLRPPAALTTADTSQPALYRLGIFPYLAPRQTIELYGPVASSMEKALGRPVKLESVPSFTDFMREMSRHTYDIALIQPFDYPMAVDAYGFKPVAQLSVPLVSQFFVRSDSRFNELDDLRGTTIAMPPAQAANARMTLRALYDNNLIPGRDVEVRYFNSHDSCIQQVWVGNASACGTARPPIAIFEQRMGARLRPIYDAPAIPHIMFVVNSRISERDRVALQQEIVGWSQTVKGRILLKNLGFPAFVAPRSEEYAIMHDYAGVEPANISFAQVQAKTEINFGVFPFLTPRQLANYFAPLLNKVSKSIGKRMHLLTAANFGGFMDNVEAGSYDVIVVQPFEYKNAVRAGYLPVARMKDDLQGTFWVGKNSPYQRIEDFRGQAVALPPIDSAMSRLGMQALKQVGLEPGITVNISYHANHASCMQQVHQKTAAACVSATIMRATLPKELAEGLRKVGRTESVPGLLVMAHSRLSKSLRRQLQSALLSLTGDKESKKNEQSSLYSDLIPVDPSLYERLSQPEEAQ